MITKNKVNLYKATRRDVELNVNIPCTQVVICSIGNVFINKGKPEYLSHGRVLRNIQVVDNMPKMIL